MSERAVTYNFDNEDTDARLERVAQSVSRTVIEIIREDLLGNLLVNVLENAKRLPLLEKLLEDKLADELLITYLTEIQSKSELFTDYLDELRKNILEKLVKFFLDELKKDLTLEERNLDRRCLEVVRQKLGIYST